MWIIPHLSGDWKRQDTHRHMQTHSDPTQIFKLIIATSRPGIQHRTGHYQSTCAFTFAVFRFKMFGTYVHVAVILSESPSDVAPSPPLTHTRGRQTQTVSIVGRYSTFRRMVRYDAIRTYYINIDRRRNKVILSVRCRCCYKNKSYCPI